MKSLLLTFLFAAATAARGQSLGTVPMIDAPAVSPGQTLEISRGIATLTGNSSVTAGDHTAQVTLARGGTVNVCRSTTLHLTGSDAALAYGVDRGALEIHTHAGSTDVLLTPDLRLTTPGGGELDLRLRVSENGDTCVENRGRKAPTLILQDAFGEASYQVKPNQHVLFEHGSLKEVVDRETTPCGCPPEDLRPVPLAEALLHGGPNSVTPQQAAAAHPFPAAQSAGLAPPAPLPPDQPGVAHTQVDTTVTFDPGVSAAQAQAPAPVSPAAPLPQPPEQKSGPFHAIGRFFKRLFVR